MPSRHQQSSAAGVLRQSCKHTTGGNAIRLLGRDCSLVKELDLTQRNWDFAIEFDRKHPSRRGGGHDKTNIANRAGLASVCIDNNRLVVAERIRFDPPCL